MIALVRLRAHVEDERHTAAEAGRLDQVHDLDRFADQIDQQLAETGARGRLTPTDRETKPRKVRSTRRRQDAPDLPALPVDSRTLGRSFTGRAGRTYRPSTLLTLTLGSHGPVHTANRRGAYLVPCPCGTTHGQHDEVLGTPLDPGSYDYRAAALDAIFFARVLDRFWQNLRRTVGFQVQYAGTIELQKRLAPHGHFAVRGTIARAILKAVAAATYFQVWWPSFEVQCYTVDRQPVWDDTTGQYVDPMTREPLPTWAEALDALNDPAAQPAYVARLGTIDPREIKGVTGDTREAERCIRYITKYQTKDLTELVTPRGAGAQAHFDRLHAELSVLPCSPACANWLLYGVQPDKAGKDLVSGHCRGKVHQRETLGFTGRRVLVSRNWSGKTLVDIRNDRREWVRAVLGVDDQDDAPTRDPKRFEYERLRPDDPMLPPLPFRLLRAISQRITWADALARARERGTNAVSAIHDPLSVPRAA